MRYRWLCVRPLNRTAITRSKCQTARNSHQLAEEAIAQGNHKQAGSWLETTSDYVQNAAAWSKQKLDTGESVTLHGVGALGEKSRTGPTGAPMKLKKGLIFSAAR